MISKSHEFDNQLGLVSYEWKCGPTKSHAIKTKTVRVPSISSHLSHSKCNLSNLDKCWYSAVHLGRVARTAATLGNRTAGNCSSSCLQTLKVLGCGSSPRIQVSRFQNWWFDSTHFKYNIYNYIYITILVIGDHHPYAWKQEHVWTTRKDSEALWWLLFVGCWQLKITHRYKSTLTSIGISLNRSATEHCCRRRELRHLQKGESILIKHPRQMTLKISEQYWVDWAPQLT